MFHISFHIIFPCMLNSTRHANTIDYKKILKMP